MVARGVRRITDPSDISGCTCAEMAKFAEHISLDCRGLEMCNVTSKTVFASPVEAVRSLAHSSKGVLLGELRVCPVETGGVQRLKLGRGGARQAVRCWELVELARPRGRAEAAQSSLEFQTDKHKVIWLCPTADVQAALQTTNKGAKRTRGGDRRSSLDEQAQGLWRKGSLHLVESALTERGKWRLTISPSLEVSEGQGVDYSGRLLKWVGDRLYHHTALRKGCEVEQEVCGGSSRMCPVQPGLARPVGPAQAPQLILRQAPERDRGVPRAQAWAPAIIRSR